MSTAPLNSVLGGIGLAIPMHALLVLNGSVFGISGFLHRAVRCNTEAIMAVAGLSLGGACVGFLQGPQAGDDITSMQLPKVLLSGFLVGIGTKVSLRLPSSDL